VGMFNTLLFEGTCPRCGFSGEMEAEFKFGYLSLIHYKMGDKVEWVGNRKSGRPENGLYVGDGYVVCPKCDKDFWLTITVNHDVIVGAEVNPLIKPYIED
jgi:hypothetical protein